MFIDGYKFWFAFKTDKTRCCRYNSSKCLGKCAVDENGKIRHTAEHNHPPEPNRMLLDKFRKSLTRRAAKEATELYKIYCDESNKHIDAALLYPFTSAESAMRKARRKQLPKTPNSVDDIIHTLNHNKDLFRVHSGSDKDAIYQKTITVDDCVCMIFMHKKTFDLFSGRIEDLHVDGSFEFITQNQPSYYLITFHAVQGSLTAPILYSVSTAKSQSACTTIFAYVRDELKVRPYMIISDFDPIMQTSLAYIFPDTIIKGCWFHYTDAVLSQMKFLKLQKETAKGIGASALRMLLVLPFLPPEYMVPGLEGTRKWMKEKTILSDGLSKLCDYVENNWLRAVGTKRMSIFGTTKISSNNLKVFNKDLSNTIGQQNPVIWVILDSLTQLATKIYVKTSRKLKTYRNSINTSNIYNSNAKEVIKEANGHLKFDANKKMLNIPQKTLKRSELISETVISSATQVWIKTPVHLRNPLSFLQLVSHCINDTMYLENMSDVKERNYLNCSSSTNSKLNANSNCAIIHTSQQNNIIDTNEKQSINSSQPFTTISWNASVHQNLLQNCDNPLQDLQNAQSSPSLNIILQENTFNCPSLTHQEFLLTQPGQVAMDSQQNIYTSCFAQNGIDTGFSENQESKTDPQNLQNERTQTQNYFSYNEYDSIENSHTENNQCSDGTTISLEQSVIIQHNRNSNFNPEDGIEENKGNTESISKVLNFDSIETHEHVNNNLQNSSINSSQKILEPPPLVFFSSVKRLPCKRILPILSEPPPLVPIGSNRIKNFQNKLITSDNTLIKNSMKSNV